MMDVEYTEEDLMSYEETLEFVLDLIGRDFSPDEEARIQQLRSMCRAMDKRP